MKITYIIHEFLNSNSAGSEIYAFTLADEMKKRSNAISVYSGNPAGDYGAIESEIGGLSVRLVNFREKKKTLFSILREEIAVKRDFKKYLLEFKPDIVHIHHLKYLSPSIISIAKRKKIPVVITLHDYWFMCPEVQLLIKGTEICDGPSALGIKCAKCISNKYEGRFKKLLNLMSIVYSFFRRFLILKRINMADKIIAPSVFLGKKYIAESVNEKKVSYIYHGISQMKKPESKKSPENRVRFAFIGTVSPHKGVHVLIDAFKKLRDVDAELHIYGERKHSPEYNRCLENEAKGSNIVFKGTYNHREVMDIMGTVDVLVFPSIWYENCPLSIQEASYAGIPVLASDLGSIPEFVRTGINGYLFKAGDSEDLSHKMRMILKNNRVRKELKEIPQDIKTISQNADEIEKIYKEMI